MLWVKQSTATILKLGPFVDSTDAVTPETALSIGQADIQISKNGGAFAQTSATTPTTTHDADGWYPIPLTATDTDSLGTIKVQVAVAGALPVWAECMVIPANVFDSLVSGSDTLNSAVTEWNGVSLGTTNPLPNAAADAAGGLPISDAGGLDLDTLISRLDAAISTRMATYTQPTGFLTATFPTTVASTTNITAASGVALTSAYDAAKTAAQAGDQMDLVNSPNVTALTAIGAKLEAMILDEADATALMTAIAAKVEEFLVNEGDATATIAAIATAVDAAITSSHGAGSYQTATGFATPTNVTDARDAILTEGGLSWTTASGFAVPGDQMDLVNAPNATAVAAIQAGLSTYDGGDTAGVTTLLTRVTGAVMLANENGSSFTAIPNMATATNQAEIAGYIDTEVGAIKAVTDKLDTTLVLDGAVYDFTAAALAAAPSGSGGDATSANQTTIIAHLTGIKGATWDSSNSLESISDAIAALDVGSGSGPKAVTITVTDGTDPLDTASVSVYLSGVLKATGSTNASGQFVANVASSGTFDVVATFDGHYQASAVTFNAATDNTATVALTALSITAAPSGYTTGWLYSYDADGAVEASVSYRYRPVSPNTAATGESLSPDWNTVTSDVNGKVEFPKMRLGVTYEYQRVGNDRQVGKYKIPTDAGSTTPLPQII